MATSTGPAPSSSGVQSIDRAAAILGSFTHQRPAVGVTDIASETGLATSTVHRLLAALEFNRLVRRTSDRRYVLGPLLLQLAHAAAAHAALRDVAFPIMLALRDRVGETVGLHELAGEGDRVTVAQAESRQALRRTYTDLGTPVPLPQGAPGKALLAFLPAVQQEDILRSPLEAVTVATITDPEVLRDQLTETRRTGYSVSLGERTPGIRSAAAPIWDYTGHPIACLSISAPELRMPLGRCHELGALVRRASREVSELMGATSDFVGDPLSQPAIP
jgi:IclR family acetate operon transcriptional repressor